MPQIQHLFSYVRYAPGYALLGISPCMPHYNKRTSQVEQLRVHKLERHVAPLTCRLHTGPAYTSAEERSAGEASTSAPGQPRPRLSKSLRTEAVGEKAKICDRLIALFQEKPVKEWRQLMAFSKQWPILRTRCET